MKTFMCLVLMVISTNADVRYGAWVDVGSMEKSYCFESAKATWDQAKINCLQKGPGVRLATLRTQLESELIQQYLGTTHYPLWIGIRTDLSGNFKRVSAPQSDFYNWGDGEPNNHDIEECVAIDPGHKMKWNDATCRESYRYVCEVDKVVKVCETEYQDWKYYDGYCYSATGTHEKAEDWQSAEELCAKRKGHLASVHSQNELYFLFSNMLSDDDSLHHLWLGLKYKNGVNYNWADGSLVDFDKRQNSSQAKEGCLSLDFVYRRWNVDQCTKKRGFLCQIPQELTTSDEISNKTTWETHGLVYITTALETSNSIAGEVAGVVINILLSLLVLSVLLIILVRWLWVRSRSKKSLQTKWSALKEEDQPLSSQESVKYEPST